VLDSNEYILGLSGDDEACKKLIGQLDKMTVFIPLMVVKEVVRNLEREYGPELGKAFFALINQAEALNVIWTEPPTELVEEYAQRGMSPEDSVIGACCEWVGGEYLISENRHFLEHLRAPAFEVIDAKTALTILSL